MLMWFSTFWSFWPLFGMLSLFFRLVFSPRLFFRSPTAFSSSSRIFLAVTGAGISPFGRFIMGTRIIGWSSRCVWFVNTSSVRARSVLTWASVFWRRSFASGSSSRWVPRTTRKTAITTECSSWEVWLEWFEAAESCKKLGQAETSDSTLTWELGERRERRDLGLGRWWRLLLLLLLLLGRSSSSSSLLSLFFVFVFSTSPIFSSAFWMLTFRSSLWSSFWPFRPSFRPSIRSFSWPLLWSSTVFTFLSSASLLNFSRISSSWSSISWLFRFGTPKKLLPLLGFIHKSSSSLLHVFHHRLFLLLRVNSSNHLHVQTDHFRRRRRNIITLGLLLMVVPVPSVLIVLFIVFPILWSWSWSPSVFLFPFTIFFFIFMIIRPSPIFPRWRLLPILILPFSSSAFALLIKPSSDLSRIRQPRSLEVVIPPRLEVLFISVPSESMPSRPSELITTLLVVSSILPSRISPFWFSSIPKKRVLLSGLVPVESELTYFQWHLILKPTSVLHVLFQTPHQECQFAVWTASFCCTLAPTLLCRILKLFELTNARASSRRSKHQKTYVVLPWKTWKTAAWLREVKVADAWWSARATDRFADSFVSTRPTRTYCIVSYCLETTPTHNVFHDNDDVVFFR